MHTHTTTPLAQLDAEARREARKAERIAAAKARRGTSEWRAEGEALQAAKLAERRRVAQQAAAAADRARPVTDRELRRAIRQAEAAISEAAAEYRYDHPDHSQADAEAVVAHDVVGAVCYQLRPALARELRRVVL